MIDLDDFVPKKSLKKQIEREKQEIALIHF